jgi:hypothetical protein
MEFEIQGKKIETQVQVGYFLYRKTQPLFEVINTLGPVTEDPLRSVLPFLIIWKHLLKRSDIHPNRTNQRIVMTGKL